MNLEICTWDHLSSDLLTVVQFEVVEKTALVSA